ncbi:MAG: hypothetical protein WBA74_05545 [Cyclobacteriaceae bacterium]
MKTIEIVYKTINVPAPFAHFYELELQIGRKIEAAYEVQSMGREDLTEEEILEEGFTPDDDFSWKGEIDPVWKKSIEDLLSEGNSSDNKELNEFTQTELTIRTVIDGKETNVTFYDNEILEYKIQEIVQALFEKSGRELPLKVSLLHKKNGQSTNYEVTVSFAQRNSSILKEGKLIKDLNWENAGSLMSLIYQPDYLLDTTKTQKDDLYISFEKGHWFSVSEIEENERLSGFKQELLKFLN